MSVTNIFWVVNFLKLDVYRYQFKIYINVTNYYENNPVYNKSKTVKCILQLKALK